MKAIVLAGGKGTRLRSQVSAVPKPMAPIRSRPFLEYLLDYWIAQGVSHFILSIGHLSNVIASHFGNSYRGIPISFSIENTPLGTGGAVAHALPFLQDDKPALLLNGDSFLEVDLAKMTEFHNRKKSAFTLALTQVHANNRYGSVGLDPEQRCTSMTESTGNEINGGVYIFSPYQIRLSLPRALDQPLSLEKDMIPSWIARGDNIFGWKTPGRFIDIGTPEDYKRAQNFFD